MCYGFIKRRLKFYLTVICLSFFNFILIRIILYSDMHVLSSYSAPSVVRSLQAPVENCGDETKKIKIENLTLFTTFEYIESKYIANKNALMNWKSIQGIDNFIMFTNCKIAYALGTSLDYTVLPVTDTESDGVPVLKTMYMTVLSMFPSTYVMFSNADILYDMALLDSVDAVHRYVKHHGLTTKPAVIVGKRTNLNINSSKNETWKSLIEKSHFAGEKFIPHAQDYFIISNTFPWEKIPRFVIGRVGYDNWLVAFSRFKNFTVVDATESILAVHQTISGVNNEGFTRKNYSYNRDLIEASLPPFKYAVWGRTDCCSLETTFNRCGEIYVSERSILAPFCFHHHITYYVKKMLGF